MLQYSLMIVFTLFTLYFSISSYRLYHIKSDDLNGLTHKVESIWLKEARGKQGKPEVWIDMGKEGRYRVAYGNNELFHTLAGLIKKDDVITILLKKEQHVFIDLGNANDVLQIEKDGQVLYSLDVPQKNFHDFYLFSAIMTVLLPLACIFYWMKSKRNLLETLQSSAGMHQQLNVG